VAAAGCTQSNDTPVDVVVAPPESATGNNDWLIRVNVRLSDGKQTTQADIATYWSANGLQWDDDGVFHKVKTENDAAEYWNDEGSMEPYPTARGTISDNGQFTIKKSKTKPYIVLALNSDRTQGGLAAASPKSDQPVTIQFERLARVFGKIRCDGQVPGWTHAYVYAPGLIKELPD